VLFDQALPRRQDLEPVAESLRQLATLEEEPGVAGVTDAALVDEERVPEQDTAEAEPCPNLAEQPAIEEAHHNDGVHGAATKRRRVEVHLDAGDGRLALADAREALPRHVHGDGAMPAAGQERGVPAAARGQIERPPPRQEMRVLDEERRWRIRHRGAVPVPGIPALAVLPGHREAS
jgi:hypothetical protein